MENLRSYNQYEGRICAKEGKGVLLVEERERRGVRIHTGATEKRIHPTLKVTSNSASVLCRKERQQEVDSAGLPISKQVDY